jgi:hypothetical protein
MKKLIRKTRIMCLSVLLGFLLAASGLQGYVICHGEDGHIAIEAADSICCSTISSCSHRACSADSAETVSASEPDCGACTDIPLSVGFAAPAKEYGHGSPTLTASSTIAFAAADSPDFSEYQLVSEFSVPPRTSLLFGQSSS